MFHGGAPGGTPRAGRALTEPTPRPTTRRVNRPLPLLLPLLLVACSEATAPSAAPTPGANGSAAPGALAPATTAAAGSAAVGKPAPDFTLTDLDGKAVHLADYRGKTVVLEWFNPECPFVKLAHGKGSLRTMAAEESAKGVVWLAINSGAPGKQGHGREVNVKGKADFGLTHPILLDETGAVGKSYGATNTPHVFVIDPAGTLVYAGALDDTRGGEPEPGEAVKNYVALALQSVATKQPLAETTTKAWGCSVKYAN